MATAGAPRSPNPTRAPDRRHDTARTAGEDPDPTNRVHHHARLDGGGRASGGLLQTLCGLRIRPRPEAAHMPCCPMCGAEMAALGRRCGSGPS